jgi:hypothetical protein
MANDTSVLTPEQALDELRERVNIRSRMGGALYYNILNDECCQLATNCARLGCNREEIKKILGPDTFF